VIVPSVFVPVMAGAVQVTVVLPLLDPPLLDAPLLDAPLLDPPLLERPLLPPPLLDEVVAAGGGSVLSENVDGDDVESAVQATSETTPAATTSEGSTKEKRMKQSPW
jgi:hypothetical protein